MRFKEYITEADNKHWITSITSATHEYMFLGGGYKGKPENDEARKKAIQIRKKYPELKSGTIKQFKFRENEIRGKLDKLRELPEGAKR